MALMRLKRRAHLQLCSLLLAAHHPTITGPLPSKAASQVGVDQDLSGLSWVLVRASCILGRHLNLVADKSWG